MTTPPPLAADAAVVLAGGTGRRLGGADKAGLRVGADTLLQRALRTVAAVVPSGAVVVVGPDDLRTPGARTVREEPAYGGPAAALLAGLRAVPSAETALVLAVDMPGVTATTLRRLAEALGADADAAGAVLDDGRAQPLCAAYRPGAVLAAAPPEPTGLAVRSLLRDLRLVHVGAVGAEAADVDTPDDLRAARERLGGGAPGS